MVCSDILYILSVLLAEGKRQLFLNVINATLLDVTALLIPPWYETMMRTSLTKAALKATVAATACNRAIRFSAALMLSLQYW